MTQQSQTPRARDGPAAVAVRTPGSINLPGPCPLGRLQISGNRTKTQMGNPQLEQNRNPGLIPFPTSMASPRPSTRISQDSGRVLTRTLGEYFSGGDPLSISLTD
jgi:hypothetical protein